MYSTARQLSLRNRPFIPSWKFISTTSVGKNTAVTLENDEIVAQQDPRIARAKPFDEMPKITSFPFIGSSWIYYPIVGRYSSKKLHLSDRHKHEVYGDVVREQFGSTSVVMSFRAEDMETVLRHEGKYPFRLELPAIKAYRESRKQWYSTSGLSSLQGKDWYDLRSKVQAHLMKPKEVHAYLDPIQDVARDLSSKIRHLRDKNKEIPDLVEELYKWSLESIAFIGLDTRFGCLEKDPHPDSDGLKMLEAHKEIFENMKTLESLTGRVRFWKYFPTPTWKKFARAGDVFSELSCKYINKSFKSLKDRSEDEELTLLQTMLLTKGMDFSKTMVTVTELLLGGIESTSSTAAYLLYNLAKNPEKQEKLYQDLKRILPSKSDKITRATFNELRYLKYCLKESMRKDPVVRLNSRVLDHDVVISGYRVPAGTPILIMLQVISRSEKYYKDADEFIPERWNEQENKPHPYSNLPFGVGPRSCVGRRFFELEIICLVMEIVRNYRLEYHHEDIGMNTGSFSCPDRPLKLKFIDR